MIPGTELLQLSQGPERLVGVYPALVTDVQDPDGQGRVKVSLPFVNGAEGPQAAAWARLATFMAGADRGGVMCRHPRAKHVLLFITCNNSGTCRSLVHV